MQFRNFFFNICYSITEKAQQFFEEWREYGRYKCRSKPKFNYKISKNKFSDI